MTTYKLDYTIWNLENDTNQRIKDDIVQFEAPKDYKEILAGLWHRWVLIRGTEILIGDCNITQLGKG